MAGVRVKENEPIDSAIRRFKKQCEKTGILAELRKREHYEKPSVRRKKKAMAARKRAIRRTARQPVALAGAVEGPGSSRADIRDDGSRRNPAAAAGPLRAPRLLAGIPARGRGARRARRGRLRALHRVVRRARGPPRRSRPHVNRDGTDGPRPGAGPRPLLLRADVAG